jgi:hypothetical protein
VPRETLGGARWRLVPRASPRSAGFDLLQRQVRVVGEELVEIRIRGQLGDHQIDGHAGVLDHRLAHHHAGINRDARRKLARHKSPALPA